MEPTAPQDAGAVQPQSSPQPQNAQSSSQFTPTTVALTKAIGQAESGGNYTAPDKTGDGASSEGAYQMTPSFLAEWGPKAGVQYQSGMTLSPQQQDDIAANAVQTMNTSGDPAYPELGKLDLAQITSAWNTGNPDAYLDPDYGQNNTYGSTENYVNKVAQYYDEETGGQTGSSNADSSNADSSNTSGSSIVPTADAASSPSDTSNSGNSDLLTTLEGLGLGAAGWITSKAIQYGAKPLEDAAIDAGIGAVGGPEGAASGALAGVAQGVIQDAVGGGQSQNSGATDGGTSAPQTSSDDSESEIPQSVAASSAVKDALSQTLGTTQGNRVFSGTQAGQDAINTASQFGIVEPDEEGNLSFNSEKLQNLESAIEEGRDGVINSQEGVNDTPVHVMSAANNAGSYIGKDRTNTQADRNKAGKIVQNELDADSGGTGEMTLSQMREAQKTHYKAAQQSYTNPKPNAEMLAHKALGHGYGKAIRDRISDKDKPLYDKLTKMSRDLTNVKQLKKRVEGKKAPKNKGVWESFLRQGARAAEIYIGDKLGGPLGAIIGGLAGEQFNRKLDQKFGRNVFETRSMKAALDILHNSQPKEYTKLINALKKRGVNISPTNKAKTEKEKVINVQKDENIIYAHPSKKGIKGLISLH